MAAEDRIRVQIDGSARGLQAAAATARQSISGIEDQAQTSTRKADQAFDRLRASLRRPFKAQVEADTGRAQREISRISAALRRFGATRKG